MGKALNKQELVRRTGKVSFYGVGSSEAHTFTRMEGFTEITTSKNATEYGRQYVDEDSKRTDITGYDTSKSYNFDRHKDNAVHEDIISITENELTGKDAVREIVTVDMTTVTKASDRYYADAYRRAYTVIPDTDGDTTDCMTYSGTFKANGAMTKIQVSSYDPYWGSCYAGLSSDLPVLTNLTVTGATFTDPTAFNSGVYYYQMTSTAEKATLTPSFASGVTAKYMVNGVEASDLKNIALNSGTNSVVITLDKNSAINTYAITITRS